MSKETSFKDCKKSCKNGCICDGYCFKTGYEYALMDMQSLPESKNRKKNRNKLINKR